MKKFEEEFNKKVGTFDVVGHHNGVCCLVEEVKALGKDWVSPEDHQAKVDELNKKIDWLHGLLDERNEEVLTTIKLLNEAQPEIPGVPPFMDEWLKSDSLEDLIDGWYNHTSYLPENVKDYLDSLGEDVTTSEYCYKEIIYLIARAKLDGYTVSKGKRFYLKHELKHELTGQFLAKRNQESDYRKYFFWNGENPLTHSIGTAWELKFTQQEIDSMETGSYEQIPVEEKHG
jgi:Protein of unknown function (DUF1642).